MKWLAEQGYRVSGVEINASAVEAFFEENKLTFQTTLVDNFALYTSGSIRIYCGDFFDIGSSHIPDIDAVYDRASLIALPPGMRTRYVEHLNSLLRPGTRSLLVTLDYPQQQISGPPFSVTPTEVKALYASRYDIESIHSEDCLSGEENVYILEIKGY